MKRSFVHASVLKKLRNFWARQKKRIAERLKKQARYNKPDALPTHRIERRLGSRHAETRIVIMRARRKQQ